MYAIKKLLCVILALNLFVTNIIIVSADVLTKEIGSTIESFDTESGVLTISGTTMVREDMIMIEGPSLLYFLKFPWGRYDVKKIVISEGISGVNYHAFYDHKNVTEVVLPETMLGVGEAAFAYTALEEVVLPNSLMQIVNEAFAYTPLKKIEIPYGCIVQGNVFKGCEFLSEVTIPKGWSYIDKRAFRESLVWEDESNWEDSIFYMSNAALDYVSEQLTDEELVLRNDTDTIIKYFLQGTKVRAVTFPEGIEVIPEYVCSLCDHLVAVFIPDSVKEIKEGAFLESELLTIYCSEGSAAQEYAIKNKIPYDTVNKDLSNAPTKDEVYEILYPKETGVPTPTPTKAPIETPKITEGPTEEVIETPIGTEYFTETPALLLEGDTNEDDIVDAKDALMILKHAAKLEIIDARKESVADINNDGIIDATDALFTLQIAANLI